MSYNLSRRVKRNKFNLSETNGLSGRMGDLIPVYVNHLIPGDTFNIKSFLAARFNPMQSPIMTNVDIKTWGFAVPYRIIWDESQEFFVGKNKSGDVVNPVFPRANLSVTFKSNQNIPEIGTLSGTDYEYWKYHTENSLSDYLDLPCVPFKEQTKRVNFFRFLYNSPEFSMLEPRAYQSIYNNYFRDQNLEDEVKFGTDSYIYDFNSERARTEYKDLMTIRKKAWAKDYFTSALPSPTMTDDVYIGVNLDPNATNNQIVVNRDGSSSSLAPLYSGAYESGDRKLQTNQGGTYTDVNIDPNGTLNSGTIRELTRARMVYQYLLDVANAGSSRYKDWVKGIFNVTTPDARIQIPEYIGGDSQNVIISEVLQTSETDSTPQGTMSGRATSVGGSHNFTYTAREHTIIMIIACVMPRPSYSSGLPRRHSKFDRFEYYLPQFDHIGDQEIRNSELQINLQFNEWEIMNNATFGYQKRFAEYKSSMDRVHGDLRTSLDFWTMARSFGSPSSGEGDDSIVLNANFIKPTDALLDRPFYVLNVDQESNPSLAPTSHFYLEIGHNVDAYRPMSKMSNPIV